MAYDLSTATQAAQRRGVQPPEGADYNTWVMQWFENALNAGDPEIVKMAGGSAAEEGEGGIADWTGAASSSEWIGKRAPTPRELRKYAHEQGWSEDFQRFDDRQLAAWLNEGGWDVGAGKFEGGVEKPTETGGRLAPGGYGGGGGGGEGGGGGGGGGGVGGPTSGGTYSGAPAFTYEKFVPPSWEEAMSDPGYQFALKEGANQLQGSAAAQGLLRSSGTLKDLMKYGQDAAATQYGNVYNRAANTYNTNLGLAKDIFAPQYGSWQTQYAGDLSKWTTGYQGDLSKWTTRYQGDLSKYLQREGNIYGLLNPAMPSY